MLAKVRLQAAVENKDPEEAATVVAVPQVLTVEQKRGESPSVVEKTPDDLSKEREKSPDLPKEARQAMKDSYQNEERQVRRARELRQEIRELTDRGAASPESVTPDLQKRMEELAAIERGVKGAEDAAQEQGDRRARIADLKSRTPSRTLRCRYCPGQRGCRRR